MINIHNLWINVECPNCNYLEDVQLIEIKSEVNIFCHNCKMEIKLIDNESSLHAGIESINSEIKKLENIFKNLGK